MSNYISYKDLTIGQMFATQTGKEFEVVKIINSQNIIVRFTDIGEEKKVMMRNINLRSIKHPNDISVCGIGFIGIGEFKPSKDKKCYAVWVNMLSRCYEKKSDSYKSYGAKGVYVCCEWHNFQNFAKWYVANGGLNVGFEVDKDGLVKGNLVYSPETCQIISKEDHLKIKTKDSSPSFVYYLVSPLKEIIKVNSLSAFCRSYGIDRQKFYREVISGNGYYLGWATYYKLTGKLTPGIASQL